ncbi:hypothetical protein D3C84_965230 [compost metagenome]
MQGALSQRCLLGLQQSNSLEQRHIAQRKRIAITELTQGQVLGAPRPDTTPQTQAFYPGLQVAVGLQ